MEYNKELLEIKQRIVETCFLSVADGPIIINGIDEAFTLGVLQANPAVERFTLPADPELDQANPPDVTPIKDFDLPSEPDPVPAKRKGGRITLTALGETKTVKEWLADPRCKASKHALYHRISQDYEPDWSVTEPSGMRIKPNIVTLIYTSLEVTSDVAKRYGVSEIQVEKIRNNVTYRPVTKKLLQLPRDL